MYCSKCGNQLTDGEKVCPKCGFSLEEEEKLVETVSHAPIQYRPSGQECLPSKYEYYVTPQRRLVKIKRQRRHLFWESLVLLPGLCR